MTALAARPAAGVRPVRGRVDVTLVLATLALLVAGALLVASAARGPGGPAVLSRHVAYAVLAVAVGAAFAAAPRRLVLRAGPVAYAAALGGLVLVLGPLGARVNGARSWLALPGGLTVQPAEAAKVALVLCLALLLGGRPARPGPRATARAVALAAPPAVLVLVQPDLGSTLVLAALVVGVLAVAGVPARLLAALVLAGATAAVLAVRLGLVASYQLDRLAAFAAPDADVRGAGWNVAQARAAVSSGGWDGTGLFAGPRTGAGLVPEQHTDFVITVAGEELGFLGAAGVVALLGVVLWRCCRVAGRADAAGDRVGALLAAGVVCWLGFQGFQNVGMALGLLPVTGLPLPFVSYGGSALLAAGAGVGLVLHVGRTAGR